ncbi:MAG: carboxypeptidase regulatory-like domain-containing protein [Pyrinomonadaceae bacterium]
MKKSIKSFVAANSKILALLGIVLCVAVLGFAGLTNSTRIAQFFTGEGGGRTSMSETDGEAADDLEGAMLYEFNMTKDPATGKIPAGIREAELAQANSLGRESKRPNAPQLGAYTYVGPNNLGGRTRSIAYDVRFNGGANQVILAGGISGGLFKSTDNGATWVRKSPTGDVFSVTTIAQDPRAGFQDTWYYAGGEASGNSTSATGAGYRGKGIFKSTDNGETWTFLPNSNTGTLEVFDDRGDYISKLVVDPTNGNVFAGVVAGILRSTDGGLTWDLPLSGGFSFASQFADIVVTSTGRFYAGFAGSNSVGADGVFTSTTGAPGSWARIAGPGGTPTGWSANGAYGRLVLAVAPSNETIVYALYYNNTTSACGAPAPEAKLFRVDMTNPAAPVWVDRSANLPDEPGCLSGNDPFAVQGGYDLVMAVKPDDANTVFIGGTNSYRSTDGFATTGNTARIGGYGSPASYALYANSHPDVHAFAFQPGTPATMLCGNDGGIQRTTDDLAATVAWTQINTGYRTYQYYYAVIDPRTGNSKVLGGAQDNGSTRNIGGAGSSFESVFGGDGVAVGLSNLIGGIQYEYVGSQNGNIVRRDSTDGPGFGTGIKPNGAGSGLFVTLFKLDPDNSDTLYYANGASLYRTVSASTVDANTWTNMTGIAGAVGGASISAIGLSRGAYNAATSSLFFGTSDGRVFRLDDPTGVGAGTAPVNITGAGFPAGAYVSSISANPTNDDTVLVTFSNYAVTSVFWTGNANAATPTWTAVEGTLTLPSYRSSAIIDNGAGGLQYFVGTSTGLYNTGGLPGAPAWTQEGPAQMGNSVVSSLDLRPADKRLLVGTHGSGMWTTSLAPTASGVSVSGRVLTEKGGRGMRNAVVSITDQRGVTRSVTTGAYGTYRFDDVRTGETYTIRVRSRRLNFDPRVVSVTDSLTDVDLIAN